jgi:HSP20 family molecular chaperone IbpA
MSIFQGNSDPGKLSQWGSYVVKAWRGVARRPRIRQGASPHPSAFSSNTSSNATPNGPNGPAHLGPEIVADKLARAAPSPSPPDVDPDKSAPADGWEIWETARFVIVRLQVPGLQARAPDDLKVRVRGNAVLFISGRAQTPGRTRAAAFEKHIGLPASVSLDIAEVTVASDQALVTVILAKEGEPMPPHG